MFEPIHVAETVPYAWPYDGRLVVNRMALIICGAQRQLMQHSADSLAVTERLLGVAELVRGGGGTVIWLRHGARPGPTGRPVDLLPQVGSADWELGVTSAPADTIIDCPGWDGCFGTDLDHRLRGSSVTTVALGGFATEVTVDSTVRTLNDRGHECLILSDGCAPLDPELGARAHHSVTMSGGIFGALGRSSALRSALLEFVDRIDSSSILSASHQEITS
jgi:biuret amidohydrolase